MRATAGRQLREGDRQWRGSLRRMCVSAGSVVYRHPDIFSSKLRGGNLFQSEAVSGRWCVARALSPVVVLVLKRRRQLIRLGVPRRQAIRHARSRKSYWHMSKTIASGVGLTNAWLAEQGMVSMKTIWAKLAPLRRTASRLRLVRTRMLGGVGRIVSDGGPYPILSQGCAYSA